MSRPPPQQQFEGARGVRSIRLSFIPGPTTQQCSGVASSRHFRLDGELKRVQIIAVSQNAKTGPIPASIVERAVLLVRLRALREWLLR
jgi:hypothetical protein